MDWNKYFEMMIDWKKLPAYRAEPRIDSFIGFYLPSILADHLKVDIDGIIPEFPLRTSIVKPENIKTYQFELSCKVDFLAIGKNSANYLVELKSDMRSLNDPQYKYLKEAQKAGTGVLVEGVNMISNKSKSGYKYDHLKENMQKLGLLDNRFNYSGKNPELKIVYIMPSDDTVKKDIITIKFDQVADWFEKEFNDSDSFERALSTALRKWGND